VRRARMVTARDGASVTAAMRDARPRTSEQRVRLPRWAGEALFWLGVVVAAATTAALILGFELFLRIAFQSSRTRTVLLVVAGASLLIIMLRADWLLHRETRRIRSEQERRRR
jgi:hypothetical protein